MENNIFVNEGAFDISLKINLPLGKASSKIGNEISELQKKHDVISDAIKVDELSLQSEGLLEMSDETIKKISKKIETGKNDLFILNQKAKLYRGKLAASLQSDIKIHIINLKTANAELLKQRGEKSEELAACQKRLMELDAEVTGLNSAGHGNAIRELERYLTVSSII